MGFRLWIESSLSDLYMSAVEAFPHTNKRQHAIDPVVVKSVNWIPYLGMKTLLCRGLVESDGQEYNPIIQFKKVRFLEPQPGVVEIKADDGSYYIERMFNDINDVNVRCNCPDFRYRFSYYNYVDHSLFGRKHQHYIANGIGPPANPAELPGICKHIMKVMQVLNNEGILD